MKRAALSIALAALAWGQQFEVVSLKQTSTKDGSFTFDFPAGGRFTGRNLAVKNLLRISYQLEDYQIAGGPSWMDSAGFDIEAKPSVELSREQVRQAIQALLADRFHLVSHRETRQLPIYALVVGKAGSKLQPAAGDASSNGTFKMGELKAPKMSMSGLASILTFDLKRPVRDQTGLKGDFAFSLDWTRGLTESDAGPSARPSIFTAVQEQLGLKLESTKGPVEVLVVDRLEMPTGN
jgi:uncharacterized protein (TIGR03435 family)